MQSQVQFSYYPGCSVEGMNKAYDKATRVVCEALDINLTELTDWNCCGATSYMAINEQRAHLLSARNLALAEKEKRDLVVVCPACLTTLTKTNRYMGEDPKLRRAVNAALGVTGMQYQGGARVRHLLEVIVNEVGEGKVKARTKKPLTNLMVAPYYGCQLTRPFGEIDDKEFPMMLDKLLSWLGAKPVDFPLKTKCCGGMLMMTNEDVALGLTRNILEAAKQNGAECIATLCPLCHINLEAYQGNVNNLFGTDFKIPILYFTQLLGLAFGFSRKSLGVDDELTPSKQLLKKTWWLYESCQKR
ncbi:MAG: CoB--CoM heterodisulfide reductase iron-sulfur subunit B family protein [Candidatus Bathyarchaeia archaeon]